MTSKAPAMTAKKKSSKKPAKHALFSLTEIDEIVAEFEFRFERDFARRGKNTFEYPCKELMIRISKSLRGVLGS